MTHEAVVDSAGETFRQTCFPMRTTARLLIAEEIRLHPGADSSAQAAVRVCERLGRSLSVLVGARGFRMLLSRALGLAAQEVAWLKGLSVAADGSLVLAAEAQTKAGQKEAANGGIVLVTQLLELLSAFIGEGLTFRILQDVWPKVAFGKGRTEGKA